MPVLTIGWVACLLHRTTSRLETRGLALLVQLDDAFGLQPLQGQLHYADGTLDYALARADDRAGLLLAEHGLGDLGA